VAQESESAEKLMRLRYAGTCRICGAHLPARTEAVYERATRTVRCVGHLDSYAQHDDVMEEIDTIDVGTPGASARQEFDRRRRHREERVRARHPRLAGLMLALGVDPQSTKAWSAGASGEEALGRRLNEQASDRLLLLHDRRIPGSRANIDHLAVAPCGLFVIDAKRYTGQPRLKVEGGVLRPRVEKLTVGGRDRTKLVDGVLQQVEVVRAVVEDEVPVFGALCFIDADWPLIGGAFATRGVEVLWPKRLIARLTGGGPLDDARIRAVHRHMAATLPAA
jgi:hypothetical protein